jgi:hypothetical protein
MREYLERKRRDEQRTILQPLEKPARSQRKPALRFEDLDPKDPMHQLPGADLTTPPWDYNEYVEGFHGGQPNWAGGPEETREEAIQAATDFLTAWYATEAGKANNPHLTLH